MSINSKAKGSSFERYISKELTKWLTGEEKPYAFWRTSNSGGLATINSMYEDFSGDITGITNEAKKFTSKFNIELKNGYPSASLDNLFKNNKNENYKDFWIQCTRDAEKSKKEPILIFKKKGSYPILIGINEKTFENLSNKLKSLKYIKIKWELDTLMLMNFNEFLNVIKFNDIV